MTVNTVNNDVKDAQKEALDRFLEKHMLYCTVCDYNNGDCEIHNTMDASGASASNIIDKEKPYEKDYGRFIVMIQINVSMWHCKAPVKISK